MSDRLSQLTPERLRQLYVNEGKTESEIAKMFGTYQVKVGRLRVKYGIPTIAKSERLGLSEVLPVHLRSLLIGSMLGDGRLFQTGSQTAAYSEHHSVKQQSYLEWKIQQWGDFGLSVRDVVQRGYQGQIFTTHGCQALYPFWQLFYPTGRGAKTFVNLPVEWVDSLALAVWFMDDGSKTSHYARFSVSPLPVDQRILLQVLRRLGIEGKIYGRGGNSAIHIQGRTQFNRFLDLVRPHVPPCMAYKLEIQHPPKGGNAPRDFLTPERIQPLIERGFTASAIAKTFSVSSGSVRRALDRMGIARQVGRPSKGTLKELDVASATIAVQRLDPSSASFAESALKILRQTALPLATVTEEEARRDWSRLQRTPTVVEGDTFARGSFSGAKLCQRFFTYRWEARYRGNPSPREAWYDPKFLARSIRFQIAVGDPVTPVRVFRALQAVVRGPTNFRPCYAKALVEALCPEGGLVLDPCAGYGGRAVGTLAAGRRYIGVDPHPKALEAYLELQTIVGPLEFHNEAFEDVDLQGLKADLVFTSPPYFSVERYSDDPHQSWVRYPTWHLWVEGFLRPFVAKSRAHLKEDGRFCVNTKNVRVGPRVYPIVNELTQIAEAMGFRLERTIRLPLGQIGKQAQSEPVLVFKLL